MRLGSVVKYQVTLLSGLQERPVRWRRTGGFAFFQFGEIFRWGRNAAVFMDSPGNSYDAEGEKRAAGQDVGEACVLSARAGDTRALEHLVKCHQEDVSRLLWRFVRTRADLEDLVQETFLRMVRGLSSWEPRQPFRHWLLRIATNVGRDYFRRQAVRSRRTTEAGLDGEAEEIPEPREPGADPAARAAANEAKEILEGLPPDDRALLTLHYLEGWPLAQIAEQYGWTVTATKLRAWRARGRLRKLLKEKDLS